MKKDISREHSFVICAYKESKHLEACIRSVLRQEYKSNILISTGTPNDYISGLAEKYKLPLIINEGKSSLANDWNFALNSVETPLVTLAHQDDIYESGYSKAIIDNYKYAQNPIIIFTDYGELRDGRKVRKNTLLTIKRIMLSPLRLKVLWESRFVRRRVLSMGNAICCPAVTFVKSKLPSVLFEDNMKSNIDWQAWELLSRKQGSFVYVPEALMFHRIHEESTTSGMLKENARREEDLMVFKKFWPEPIAKLIEKIYQLSEKSNSL